MTEAEGSWICADGLPRLVLRSGRERSALRRHPWIFSGAVAGVDGAPAPGAMVRVESSEGETLGIGQWSPQSQIRVRMVAFGQDARFSCAARLGAAVAARMPLLSSGETDACRLVNAEADGLPGVVVDKYADWAVCQFNTAGAIALRGEIARRLTELLPLKGIFWRPDADMLRREGVEAKPETLAGAEPPGRIEITENGIRYHVDVREGHKTGFYLDQRENRRIVAGMAAGRDVLNVFSYTGGFGLAALGGGAESALNVDVSAPALALAAENAELNGFSGGRFQCVEGNAFEVLRKYRDSRRDFGMVVLDPPKFADSKGAVQGAARGYKDINLLAMKLLRPGGLLATFSCSGAITPEIFGKIVAEAAVDAGAGFTVLRRLWQAGDHAESLSFPEGLYLKGLLLRRD
ncbi:MAG: class I SAM-dependent rRNA methyltransferase [Kiritimatiellae bacterium]|nr:class I SAM-dependent rRNA methyltransferase [Kiritimatiellia bacterium]